MFTVFGYLSKLEDLSAEDFMGYYENHHVPLILGLAPAPEVYKRHYVRHADEVNFHDDALDFDVVTELGFTDRAGFLGWIAAVSSGPAGDRVAADEVRFIDRSRTRSCVVEDRVTAP
jgi:hypothetical protein